MDFQPQTEQEIKSKMCWPPGEYEFEIAKASDTESKKGNSMIALELRVFHPEKDNPKIVKDWLVPNMELKLNRFCHSVGLFEDYQAGQLSAFVCEGRSGRLKLSIESSEEFGDQNRVKDYVPVKEVSTPYSEPAPRSVPARQTKAALARDNGLDSEGIPIAEDDGIPF